MPTSQNRHTTSFPNVFVEFCGIKMTVTEDLDGHTVSVLDGSVPIEHTEFQAIIDTVIAGDIVLDIGAGGMSCALLAASRGARVIAYEPSPRLFDVAGANLDANPALHVETHLGWAVAPDYSSNIAYLRLPGLTFDEAAFDFCCATEDGQMVAVRTIEPLTSVMQRERPTVVIIEAAGMACGLTKALSRLPHRLKPRAIICRLRPSWEGNDAVHATLTIMRLSGYRLASSYLGCDGHLFYIEAKPDGKEVAGGQWPLT